MEKKKIGLFYKVLLGILLLLLGVFLVIRFAVLRPWLTRYEASQPKHTSQAVFADLFSPADWGQIYDLAGLEGGAYQDRDSFIHTMEELTGGQELTMVETSAGLSGNRRYFIKLGGENIAAFTLAGQTEGGTTAWQLDSVELLLGQTGTVSVRTLAGQRVLVNGQELGEDCQAQLTETAAERYLPEGVQGRRTVLWQTQIGSIQQADVTVLDGEGQKVPVSYDADAGCFAVEAAAEEAGEEERAALIGATKTYARYMIRQATSAQLQQYFDSGSAIYQTIRSSEIWIKTTAGHSFSNEEVSEFRRYGEDMFSARVTMHMDVKRANGSAKPYEMDSTLFFHRRNGGWRAFEMTNMDVQEETVHTRLIFMDGQEELGRLFVSSGDHSFTPPAPPERPGRRFAGWAIQERKGGNITMTVRFQPGADGTVALPAEHSLEPMTLYAAFE